MESHFNKSHVLAGVQDAYWSDDEGVRCNLATTLTSITEADRSSGE
jgi:hypothetical protein